MRSPHFPSRDFCLVFSVCDPAAGYSSMHITSEVSYGEIAIRKNSRHRDPSPEPGVIYSALKSTMTPSKQLIQSDQR
ncbi:unnamed protein product [Oreochromis niloticus]|nr:unnamed protein product [Mustela putorius furo]